MSYWHHFYTNNFKTVSKHCSTNFLLMQNRYWDIFNPGLHEYD